MLRNEPPRSQDDAHLARARGWLPKVDPTIRTRRAPFILLGWMILTVVVICDVAQQQVVLIGLLALAALCSAAAMRWRATSLIALASLAAAIVLGGPDGIAGSAQHVTECVLVALVGLTATVAAAAGHSRDEALREAQGLATHDTLTGALTRRAFFAEAEYLCQIRAEDRPSLAVAIIDIDRFKQVNDLLGHLIGDDVLTEVARRIIQHTRAGDLVCRFGGEEFALLLVGRDGFDVVERVVVEVGRDPVAVGDRSLQVTASGGWAFVTEDLQASLREADRNLYEAKRRGGDQTIGDTPRRA